MVALLMHERMEFGWIKLSYAMSTMIYPISYVEQWALSWHVDVPW